MKRRNLPAKASPGQSLIQTMKQWRAAISPRIGKNAARDIGWARVSPRFPVSSETKKPFESSLRFELRETVENFPGVNADAGKSFIQRVRRVESDTQSR